MNQTIEKKQHTSMISRSTLSSPKKLKKVFDEKPIQQKIINQNLNTPSSMTAI
jgi:hypothetical protein